MMAEAAEIPTLEAQEAKFNDAFALAAQAAEKGEPLPLETPADTAPAAGGTDTVPAAAGADTAPGAAGADTAPAAGGADTVKAAAAGADTVPAAGGTDTVPAAAGADTVAGAGAPLDEGKAPAAAPAAVEKPPEKSAPVDDKLLELTAEQKAQQAELAAALADYEFSAEEKTHYEKWKSEFPTEAAAVEARLKQIDRAITQRVYNASLAVLERVHALVTPAVQGYQQTAKERREAAILGQHTDYHALQPKVREWAKQQPGRLGQAFAEVLDQGTADEVAAVYTRYKKETGAAAPAATTAPAAEQKKPVAPSKDDVDALAPVGSKRATPAPKGGVDPNDYDGAWKEAVSGGR